MMLAARSLGIVSLFVSAVWLTSACTQNLDHPGGDDLGDIPPEAEGVGDEEWSSRDITCSDSNDCGTNEACIDNVCQFERCGDGPYSSVAPLGERMPLAEDLEIVAADSEPHEGGYYVDGYAADEDTGLSYASNSSWSTGSLPIRDIAGGSILPGEGADSMAVAHQGSQDVLIKGDLSTTEIDVGLEPMALGAGDVDGDGADDLVALSEHGRFALCKVADDDCQIFNWDADVEGIDVATGDIEGDGLDEVILLTVREGDPRLTIWRPHYEQTGQDQFATYEPPAEYKAIAAGDLTRNGVAELVALADATWYNPFDDDGVTIYRYEAGELHTSDDASTGTRGTEDIAIGDLTMSGEKELAVLYDDRSLKVFRSGQEPGSLVEIGALGGSLSQSQDAVRIATADVQGSSPNIQMASGPEIIPGDIVPILAANFPPYDEARSSGDAASTGTGAGSTSYLFMGDSESSSETYSDSIATAWGVNAGLGFSDPTGQFDAEVRYNFEQRIERTESVTTSQVIGNRFHVTPQPDVHGHEYGVVILTSGCFHGYTYDINDPSGAFDIEVSDGESDRVYGIVPVDGQVTLWSTPRYNALAREVDYLPEIDISTEIGNPDSYPRYPERGDGTPVPSEDMVFADPPGYFVSDAGMTGWWLSEGQSEAEERHVTNEHRITARFQTGPVRFGGDAARAYGEGHATQIGSELLLGGGVPPIPNDPNTPQDEHERFAFPFSPYMYTKEYVDQDGEEETLYMVNFTVGDR